MINVENDYEPIIYEQPIYFHIYQNHSQFLFNYCTRPISNSTTKKIGKIVEEMKEEKPTECSSTKNIYQNIPKKKYKKKNIDNSTSFRKFKIKTTTKTRP